MQENHKYNIYMFIATIFFGMTYVLTKICLNYSTEFHIISFRFLIAFVISLIFLQIFQLLIHEMKKAESKSNKEYLLYEILNFYLMLIA